jgi:hypothetical protein
VRTLLLLLLAASALRVSAQSSSPRELDISGEAPWTDTGVGLKAGDTLKLSATGTLRFAGARENGPEGLARGWLDLLRILPVNEAGRGALVGRVSSSDAARPFLIGPRAAMKAPADGRLFLGINEAANDQPEGSFHVTIERVARTASVALPMAGGEVQKFMDHVRYPRAALLESLVRFVVSDLETK